MYISTLLAPRLNENFLARRGSNPGSAEPEADMLPAEPTRRAPICNVVPDNYFVDQNNVIYEPFYVLLKFVRYLLNHSA